ncbi:hypothetical protein ABHN03_16890 [Paenibacillus sp. NRS-1775]|uniref:hypothetical protein n=1 Tax=unclassified Paenibacillus TaxID=185978 RepID=UPI003D2701CC
MTDEILSHSEKQIVLYTKGHFLTTDMFEDIRQITAKAFSIPVQSTHFYHLYNFITSIFLKLHEEEYISESMENFLCSLFKWKPVLKPEDMVTKMIGQISIVKASGLQLGEADEKYLPIKKKLSLK